MGLPFLKHLEWLVLEGLDLKTIHDFYDNIQLPLPTEQDLEKAQASIDKLPLPPVIKKRVNKGIFKAEDTPYWDKLGYGDLHRWRCGRATLDWTHVGKMLNHPLMRTSLDACLIAGVEQEKIVMLLPQVYNLRLTEGAIALYSKYFGGFQNFTKTDWNNYLERLREDQYVYSRIFAALTKPKEEVLHLCGLPNDKQFSDFLKNVLATANYKFNYYAKQGSSDSDISAVNWAKIGIVAGEKFEKFGAGDASDFAKLVQTEFQYVTPEIETLSPELALEMRPRNDLVDSNK